MTDAALDRAPTKGFRDRLVDLGRALNPSTGNGPTVVKLLLYAVMCFTLLGVLVALIGNRAFFADRATYQAELPDATGLFDSDSVRIAGVPVGRVTGISAERGVAVVSFELDDHVEVPTDTQVAVRWRNVLGQKYLYLYPGEADELLDPGDRIPVDQAIEAADFGRFLNSVGPVLRAVDPEDANAFVRAFAEALDGNEAKVKQLFGDAATVTRTVGDLDTELGTIITQLEQLLSAIAQRDGDLATLVDDLASTSATLADNNQLLAEVITSFRDVQAQMRQVIEQNRGDFDAIVASLAAIGDTLTANLDALDRGLATLPAGTAAYHEISAQGQWFNIRARILCFSGQQTCFAEELNPDAPLPSSPAGAGGGGAAPAREPGLGGISDIIARAGAGS